MGRNKGDGSRSKSRTSSSSLAASLLPTPVTSAVGFGGFVGGARVDVPLASDGEHLQDVDGDAFLHLKRLSKRDPTTKLKALAALNALFQERSPSDVSTLLPAWVFEYKKLAHDNSRQVRQSTHVAMASLATCVGRGLAPHLRSLMGTWWIVQFDPSREVAEAAKASFQVAFSEQRKRWEALVFSEHEILSHIAENLKQSPQTLSDKTTPIEESTEKYERVLSCSLLALAALIDILVGSPSTNSAQSFYSAAREGSTKPKASVKETAKELCWNHKFLQQFVKSKGSRVRAAAYQVLRSYIQNLPEVFREEDMDVAVPTILGTFTEKDHSCHQPMWDMVLLFTKAFPDAWDMTSVRKAVIPGLWGFLQHGCYGSEQVSYPYLLPLISLIPPRAVLPAKRFLLELFAKLWQGLSALQVGSANHKALLQALNECLVWTVLNSNRYCEAHQETVEFQLSLIENVLTNLLLNAYIGRNISSPAISPADASVNVTAPAKAKDQNVAAVSSDKFTQDVGSCLVQIIHSLSGHTEKLLGGFWDEFHRVCFCVVEEAGDLWKDRKETDLRVPRIAAFFVLLKDKMVNTENGYQWQLKYAVRPFVAKSFPAIQAKESPESIRLMAALVSLYGPSVFSLSSLSSSEQGSQTETISKVTDLDDDDIIVRYLKAHLIPWCLDQDSDLTASKSELVLGLIETRQSQELWDFVLSYVTAWQDGKEANVDVNQIGVLGTLLGKVREKLSYGYSDEISLGKGGSWKSSRIDAAAVRVASSHSLSNPACLHFLRTVLGGKSSEQALSAPFISEPAVVAVLECLFLHQLRVLPASGVKWIRSAPALLMDATSSYSTGIPNPGEVTDEHFQSAVSAINIFGNCIVILPSLLGCQTISGRILSAMFCLKWACSNLDGSWLTGEDYSSDEHDSDVDSEEEIVGNNSFSQGLAVDIAEESHEEAPTTIEKFWDTLRESLLHVWSVMSPKFCKSFSALTRFGVRDALISCLRLAVLDEEEQDADELMIAKCAKCAYEVVSYACEGPDEVSEAVDSLLSFGESWPVWVSVSDPSNPSTGRTGSPVIDIAGSEIKGHDHFVSFVDHLCRVLGPQEVFLHSPVQRGPDMYRNNSLGYMEGTSHGRAWLVVELLCTWDWPGGSALQNVLPFLWSLAGSRKGSDEYFLLWDIIERLFRGGSNSVANARKQSDSISTTSEETAGLNEPFLRALLVLLKGLLEREDGWGAVEARDIFHEFVTSEADVNMVSSLCDVQILPHVLSLLMPVLRKAPPEPIDSSGDEEWQSFLQTVVSIWMQKAMSGPPLVALTSGSEISGYPWILVAVSCFPLHTAGGAAAISSASSASVTSQERALLLALLRKHFSREALAAVAADAAMERMSQEDREPPKKISRNQELDGTLAKLVAVAVAYCWPDFGNDEWTFVLKKLRAWLQDIVVEAEEFTEAVANEVNNLVEAGNVREDSNSLVTTLESLSIHSYNSSAVLSGTAVSIYSLLRGLSALEGADSTESVIKMNEEGWSIVEMRALEDILRVFLAIGLAESVAGSDGGERGANVVASRRLAQGQLWDNVAEVAISASIEAREASIRAVDLWGVGKGAISALYALLHSPQPTISLQWAAYQFLSSHKILDLAITQGTVVAPNEAEIEGEGEGKGEGEGEVESEVKVKAEEAGGDSRSKSPALVAQVRPELARVLQTSHSDVLQSPLTSSLRVSFMLGWGLVMTRLQSLTALSPIRERLVQYIQDSDISPTLLDCLFQHISLESSAGTARSRRRNAVSEPKVSSAAAPASRASATGSVAFAVEGLWPIDKESVGTLAGSLYGLMLLVLPACVRVWFTGLRDKSLASAVEAFTTAHCSPQLLANEFTQVQSSAVDDESLSIKSNRSQREVTAIYKKEDAGIDVVVRIPMPACYPLRAVDVEFTRRMGISETLLRKWVLSMAAFLRNQNGAVVEAVLVWKKNIDREFEGVEECPICYSVIHTLNHQLPKLACKTCRHKFHSACLYKWFSTSHQSTCPLCKTPF